MKKSPTLAKLQKDLASCNERNRKLAAKLHGVPREGALKRAKDYLFGPKKFGTKESSRLADEFVKVSNGLSFVRSSSEAYEAADERANRYVAVDATQKELAALFGRAVRTPNDGPVWYVRRGNAQFQIWFPSGPDTRAQVIGPSSGVEALAAYINRAHR